MWNLLPGGTSSSGLSFPHPFFWALLDTDCLCSDPSSGQLRVRTRSRAEAAACPQASTQPGEPPPSVGVSEPLSKKVLWSEGRLCGILGQCLRLFSASERPTSSSCKIKMFGSDLFIRRTPTLCSKDLQQNKAKHGSQDVNRRQTKWRQCGPQPRLQTWEQVSAAVIIKSTGITVSPHSWIFMIHHSFSF